eukprot:gene11442-12794_t
MSSTYIAFIRNFACVLNSLLPADNTLRHLALPKAPAPLNEVSIIELIIAVTQFAAVGFNLVASYVDSIHGYREYQRSHRLLVGLDRLSVTGGPSGSVEYTVLRHRIQCDQFNGSMRFFVGLGEFFIGCAYLFLMANSLHLRGPTHPTPLINALIVMEIALAYILLTMWRAFLSKIVLSLKARHLAIKLQQLPVGQVNPQKVVELAADSGYLDNLMDICPILDPTFRLTYSTTQSLLIGLRNDLCTIHDLIHIEPVGSEKSNSSGLQKTGKGGDSEGKDIFGEVRSIDVAKPRLSSSSPSTSTSTSADNSNKTATVSNTFTANQCEELIQRLHNQSQQQLYQAFMAFIYFALNLIAAYGYMLCCLAFYFPQASLDSAQTSDYIASMLMFNLPNSDADWYGNFVGDLCWTIEPFLILFVDPWLSKYFSQSSRDKKTAAKKKQE